MNDILTTKETKLFGLPRPTAGALIGIFLLLAITFWLTKFWFGFVILISPGLFIRFMMSPWVEAVNISVVQNIASYSIIFGVSIVPPAILGLLITFNDKKEKTNGIIMLLLYLIIIAVLGTPMNAIFAD